MKITILSSLLTIFVAGSLWAQTSPPAPTSTAADAAALKAPTVPPKKNSASTTKIVPKSNDEKSLNPQPLPPDDGNKKSLIIRKNIEETPLNPQPLPPKDDRPHPNAVLFLSNGTTARIVGTSLMIRSAKGEVKAAAGKYKTRDGRVLVVNAHGEISN